MELLDAVANLVAVQAEQCRRARLVPAGALERLHDERPFELLEIDARMRESIRHSRLEHPRRAAARMASRPE